MSPVDLLGETFMGGLLSRARATSLALHEKFRQFAFGGAKVTKH